VADPRDPIAGAQPVRWALQELEESLKACGVTVNKRQALAEAKSGELCILASGLASKSAAQILKQSGATVSSTSESLGLIPGKLDGKRVLLACGYDVRGLVYAVLELGDRV